MLHVPQCFVNVRISQLFQPTTNVASSLLMEYTEDESPQREPEENPHSKSCGLDTKDMFYPLVTYYCKTIIRHIIGLQK